MENKYFTPNIEDFFEGYEFEYKNDMQSNEFEPTIFDASMSSIMYNDYEHENNEYLENHYRTPYLTKEQIINEGWNYSSTKSSLLIFSKVQDNDKEILLVYDNDNNWLVISINDNNGYHLMTKFSGECKSINELRTIFKFLKIK